MRKINFTETVLRDANQSLIATRLPYDKFESILETMDKAGYYSAEVWGGATFDVCLRYLQEDPWERLRKIRAKMPNTKLQMLLRGQNILGYKHYPDDVVRKFVEYSVKNGIDIIRIFDCLNDIRNLQTAVTACNKEKGHAQVALSYTLGDAYTLDYWMDMAKRVEDMGADSLCIKDMAGLLKPLAAKELISTLKRELHVPLHLHTHDSTGNGVSTVMMAAEAGVDIVDLAIESMSSLTSQPSMNAVAEALRGTRRDTGLKPEELTELSHYYSRVREVYAPFESDMKSPNTEIYKYEIPGGQYSNLLAQVTSMGSPDDFEAIKGLYKDANDLLGNIVKVTPTSKAVGDLAIFMYKNGLTKDNILTEGAGLSYPDSVVSYFQGMMGQPYGGFPKELQKIVLKDIKPLTERPGALLPAVDLDQIKKDLCEKYHYEDRSEADMCKKAVSYALYPKVYEDYCEHFEIYNDVTRLESHVYFYGLRKGEETYLKIGEGKELLIKYLEASEPDEDGYRTLMFQVNGSIRNVKILDKKLEIKTDRKLKASKSNPKQLGANIPGIVGNVLVKEGDPVKVNTPLLTLEAMKMETIVVSTIEGVVDKIYVKPGETVHQDDLMMSFQ